MCICGVCGLVLVYKVVCVVVCVCEVVCEVVYLYTIVCEVDCGVFCEVNDRCKR